MSYLTLNRLPGLMSPDEMLRQMWDAAPVAPSDLYETPEALVIELSVPGVQPQDIKVSVTGNVLSVSGESRRQEKEGELREYYHKEVRYGRFAQSIELPLAVKGDQVTASFEHGLLKITLPKADEAKPRMIEVQVPGQA